MSKIKNNSKCCLEICKIIGGIALYCKWRGKGEGGGGGVTKKVDFFLVVADTPLHTMFSYFISYLSLCVILQQINV